MNCKEGCMYFQRWYKLTDKGLDMTRQVLKINEDRKGFLAEELMLAYSDDDEWNRIDRELREILAEVKLCT